MKLLSLAFLALASAASAVQIPTRPSEVTVYPQGARVLRTGQMELPSGAVSVSFEGLPADAVEDSLRLSAKGPAGTKLFAVRFAEAYTAEAVLQRRKELEKKFEAMEFDFNTLADAMSARQVEIDILKALGTQGSTQSGAAKSGIGTLATDVASIGKRVAALMAANRKDSVSKKALQEQLDALSQEIKNGGSASRQERTAEADLELASAGTVQFELTYQIRSANWSPLYDLRLEGDKVTLSFAGEVRQQSGEDWSKVKLELSTARPTTFAEIPDPTQWWLDFQQHYRSTGMRLESLSMLKAGGAAPAMAPAPMADMASETVQQEMAETVNSEFAISFAIKRPMSIPSDATAHRVGVMESTHKAELLLVTVPRLDQGAFIQAEVAYEGAQPLLPGPAQLFRQGEYVGKSYLQAVAPGEKFKLGFGKDDQVKVTRALIDSKTAPGKGFIFTNGKRRYHWVTSITNFHDSVRAIEVREQLPRSRQEEIKVSALTTEPKPLPEDPAQPGLVRWRLDLAPKKEQKVTFVYEIKYPESKTVTGME